MISSFKFLLYCFTVLLLYNCNTKNPSSNEYKSWEVYRGDNGSNAYSELNQINIDNVHQLEPAWIYKTGDNQSNSSIQCNPIIIDSILYATTATLKIVALHAETGKKIWEYDPASTMSEIKVGMGGTNRGLTYWENGNDKRLFYCVMNQLQSINASTGEVITSFGQNGAVDLRDNLDKTIDKETAFIRNTSPGITHNNLIIIGSSLNEKHGALPGHIRAYNLKSGELKWIFHTIPHPKEFGYDTWPKDYYKTGGGANAWSGLSIDKQRGILYAPLGSATHDFFGGDRIGKGLFANSLLALDANTGSYKWHFQTSHHDLWDYDLPAPPNLITVNHNGKDIDAVAQLTKQGFIFLLDRETGKPLFDVKEKPVPNSNINGEIAWPTQPFPVKPVPLVRQFFDKNLISDISPESHEYILNQVKGFTMGSIYSTPSEKGMIQIPGMRGGAEWSGGAFDPETGIMYVGVNDIPNKVQLVKDNVNSTEINEFDDLISKGKIIYSQKCSSCHGIDRRGSVVYPSLLHIGDHLKLEAANSLLKTGKGMMPSFKNIPEPHRRAVLAYLYNLKNEEAKTLLPLVERHATVSINKDSIERFKLKSYQQLRDQDGYPGIKPPWGKLCAVNLNSGEIEWEIPLGEYKELTKKGIPATGTQLFGGGIVTAGGVIFIGASRDEKFRAIHKKTGEILWEFQLPAGGYATPATYAINNQQYVVIAAGGGGLQGTPSGDYYYAFKLPKKH